MSFLLAIPNGQILFAILMVGVIGLFLTSVGALMGIWTWKTPQSILVLVVGVVILFFIANYTLEDAFLG
ncbi:MAG: hypothetical protein PVH18_10920 [Chloroflexota bacterium]